MLIPSNVIVFKSSKRHFKRRFKKRFFKGANYLSWSSPCFIRFSYQFKCWSVQIRHITFPLGLLSRTILELFRWHDATLFVPMIRKRDYLSIFVIPQVAKIKQDCIEMSLTREKHGNVKSKSCSKDVLVKDTESWKKYTSDVLCTLSAFTPTNWEVLTEI